MRLGPSLVMACALSLDALAVGFLYGARGIRLPRTALFIVSLASAAVLGTAMATGAWLGTYLHPELARRSGAALLVAAGLWVSYQAWHQTGSNEGPTNPGQAGSEPPAPNPAGLSRSAVEDCPREVQLLQWRIPLLGMVVRVLAEPASADLDRSGSISPGEALVLGLALASDSLGAGLGAGLAGFSAPVLAPLVGLVGWLSLTVGMRAGARLPWRVEGRWGLLHGVALMTLGMYRFF